MRAASSRAGSGPHRPDTGPHGHPVRLERCAKHLGIARMVGRGESRPGLDDRRRHPEPGIDLGELAAGRAATQDHQALRQFSGQRRLAVGPGRDLVETLDRRPLRNRADRDDHVRGVQLVRDTVVADRDHAATRDRADPAVDDGSGTGQGPDVRGVVGFLGAGRSVDHEVAVRGCRRPVAFGRVRVMPGGIGEQRLRRQAADVRAAPAEPLAIDDRDRGAQLARLVRGGLAGRSRPDDDEIVRIHDHSFRAGTGSPRCRRAS